MRTPSQTIGPFFHVGLKWEGGDRIETAVPGERIVLTGCIYDGQGAPVADALLETWQADCAGPAGGGAPARACGYGRVATDASGRYRLETTGPKACSGAGGEQYAPQISVTLFARGLLKAVRTRVFLAPVDAVRQDPLARAAGDRLSTLVAKQDAKEAGVWHWDVRLQGAGETVFISF